MGQKLKAPKGEISITNADGRIRLRWRYNGERYSLNLPFAHTPENLAHATVKIAELKLDMLRGTFDTSLKKYNPQPEKPVIQPVKIVPPKQEIMYLHELAGKFTDWTTHVRNINIELSIDYFGVRRVLERYEGVQIEDLAGKIAGERWCKSTYNKRLNFLRSFFSWLVDTGVISMNPLLHVTKRREKSSKRRNERRQPLTEDEISTFLEAIREDIFCPHYAPFKHSFYYPFLRFVFWTGVRNAEAVGLRVRHINFETKQIEISETFARTTKGTHHAARISKGTKTGNTRYLPMTDELMEFLMPLVQGKALEDFVFPSPRGLSIDDRMLARRIIKPVLKELGLGNRDLYVARHSFGTRAVQQGMAITDVAYLMGHSTVETAIRNYVSVDKPAIPMPVL